MKIFKNGEIMEQLLNLRNQLMSYERVVISFSGGIDSTLLAYYANEVLGVENVYVVIGHSQLHKESETQAAIQLAKDYRWQYQVVEFDELTCEPIKYNHPNSWYHSKFLLYSSVIQFAKSKNISVVCDGMILNDLNDYRPGLRARDDLGIISPLIEAGFDKELVRKAAKNLGILSWNQIPSCSLISRFPYNSELSIEAIDKIKKTEQLLHEAGFVDPRARYYQSLVKIEIQKKQIPMFLNQYEQWNDKIKAIGFKNVALDLEGYQTGNMNLTLNREG